MNGPLKLYRTQQIVRHDLKVQLPNCMYKLKNIHDTRNGIVDRGTAEHVSPGTKKVDLLDKVKEFLKRFKCTQEPFTHHNFFPSHFRDTTVINFSEQLSKIVLKINENNDYEFEMGALEFRQEGILKQLAELREQMEIIKNNLKVSSTIPVSTIAVTKKKGPVPSLPDVIIRASPTHPPYSLQLMQRLWKDYIFLSVQTFTHSNVASLDENAVLLTETLEKFSCNENVPKVNVRLIWKDVGPNPELCISSRPIAGEINILRYLSRVSYEQLNYEGYENSLEIDSLLDICYNIVKSKTKTERVPLLQSLNKSLGKSQWLAGRSEVSIADLAAYSAIKQITSANEINVNLGKWLQRCASC